MPLGTEVNLGPVDVVLDGVTAPSPKRSAAPSFLFMSCGQTAGWMKAPLCMEVDIGPDHIVLDRDLAHSRKGHSNPPLLGPCLLWPRSPISATAELLLYIVSASNGMNVDTYRTCMRRKHCDHCLVEIIQKTNAFSLIMKLKDATDKTMANSN